MLSQEYHLPSLPHHAHVSERVWATLGVAEASYLYYNNKQNLNQPPVSLPDYRL